MAPAFPDLVLKFYEPLYDQLQNLTPADATPDEAEDLLLLVMVCRPALQRAWKRTLANHRSGKSGEAGRKSLGVMVRLAHINARIIAVLLNACSGADASLLADATAALNEAEGIEKAVLEVQEFLGRLPATVDREEIARAHAEWERDEGGMEAEAMLARRKARRMA